MDDSRRFSLISAEKAEALPTVFHGTNLSNLPGILRDGLKPGGTKGGRTHVHFSAFPPWDEERCIGGMRHDQGVNALVVCSTSAIVAEQELFQSAIGGALLTAEQVHRSAVKEAWVKSSDGAWTHVYTASDARVQPNPRPLLCRRGREDVVQRHPRGDP